MIRVTATIALDEAEIEERFIHASGPGGQNVNKISSAVQLRFDAARSPALDAVIRRRLKSLAGRRMTRTGVLVIEAKRFRNQEANRRDALDRLVRLVRRAAVPPRPRKPTKPTRGDKERRLKDKHHRSTLKRARGPVAETEG